MQSEASYWLRGEGVSELPVDQTAGANLESTAQTVTVKLSAEETESLLREVPKAHQTQINEVLLTALLQACGRWSGERRLLVDLEGHGREEISEELDLSRTVGWFTSITPVLLEEPAGATATETLAAVKEQLRGIPQQGVGYGLLRYLSEDEKVVEQLREQPKPELSFNYLGQFDQVLNDSSPFRLAKEATGPSHSQLGERNYLLEINSAIVDGQLQMNWTYSEDIHHRATIENLAQDYLQALRGWISDSQSSEATSYAPSDFPLAKLNAEELKRLAGNERNVEEIYPLTPLQQGLLFHTLYAPESGMYFTQLSYHIHKKLNVAAFARAWQRVVDRHPILRTAFVWEGLNEPMQVVHQHVELPWEQHDWVSLSESERDEQLRDFLASDRQQVLDLSTAPVMRCALIQLTEDSYQFTWNFHHLLLDGWSMSLLFKEIFALYDAFAEGRHLELDEVRPYRDYVAWQQQQDLAESEAFWRQALKGFSAPTPLVIDRRVARVVDPENDRGDRRIKIPAAQTETLKALLKQHKLTMNTLVQGVWAMLLSHYSGEDDVVFGATVSGRPATLEGVDSIMGPFINTLPVRVRLNRDVTLPAWLRQLQTQQVEARQYEYTPLAQIQAWSEVPRGQSLFESVLVFENYPVDDSVREAGRGLEIRDVHAIDKMNYPLALVVMLGSELSFRIAYDSARFDEDSITRMLGHLENLIKEITVQPELKLFDFNLLTAEERRQILVDWNNTRLAPAPAADCAHGVFEAHVARAPHALALGFGEQRISYSELNSAANRLARHLRERGVGPEVRVALCLKRSPEMIIALLAVLKAGGTYLPLDPSYPIERLSFMLEDSQAAVLVTSGETAEELPAAWLQVIDLEDEREEIDKQSDENLDVPVSGEQAAYVIYTSGSTGRPKGVMVTHAGLLNLTEAQRESFDPQPNDHVLQFASLSFDASIFEIVMALCKGASLWLAAKEDLMPGAGLLELLRSNSITNATLPPSVLAMLPWTELPELRTLIVAGEACPAAVVDQWAPGRRFFNAYGPTETTVWATVAECHAGGGPPTIGRPIANAEVYVLDRNGQPVPVGVTGELYLGGDGLARGYLNRPELTAERFVPHAFSTKPGARLYRTGDVARYSAGGLVEFLGRNDAQVKVHGFRIELGEVEAILREHPAVRECVVVAHTTDEDTRRLVGYVVPQEGENPLTAELRMFLQEKLPDYMVPAVFMTLDALPLTPNAKIDRAALPHPDESRPEMVEAFIAPRTAVEETLAQIWSEVLHVEQVGIDDNFFLLGGDSIRSVQLLSKVQERGLNLTLQQLFKHQTIRNLVQEITEDVVSSTPSIEPFSLITDEDRVRMSDEVEDAYPLTMVQVGMLFHSEFNPDTAIYHSINTFHLKAGFSLQALRQALDYMTARHSLLHTSFDLASFSEPLQLVHSSVTVPLQEFDLRHLSHAEQDEFLQKWLEAEKVRHFDWTVPPLMRVDVHRRTDESFQFTFTAHHAIIDGWSDGLFLTELFNVYTSLLNGAGLPADPPLAATFRQYVALEREALESEECRQFWLEELSDSTSTQLPRLARADNPTRFTRVEVEVTAETSEKLKRLAQLASVPIKSVLLAAHLRVMSLLSGQADAITGVVWNGRPESTDGDRMIGLFLNTLPFHVKMTGGSWLELARKTFNVEREVMPFRRYPLSQLQRLLGGQQLFETCFNFTHMHVYDGLKGFDNVEILDGGGVAETNFALMANFSLNVETGRVQVALDCKVSDLGEELVEAVKHYYCSVLLAMTNDWHGRYEYCSLLSEAERRLLLEEYNDTAQQYPRDFTLADLFERQVARTPEAIALIAGDDHLTYAELDREAEQLALHLGRLGVGPENLVGVCLERSARLVVAVLAVLKAGGAYLPLDPAYPAERLRLMLEDSGAGVLLTERELIGDLPVNDAQVVYVGEVDREVEGKCLRLGSQPEHLAYVIYTSGSTGKPKGVAISHRSAATLLYWAHDFFSSPELSGVLASTSVCFDLSIFELFVPLTCGGSVILVDDVLQLPELPATNEVTLINTVPSAMAELVRLDAVPSSVRTVNLAGEALRRTLVEEIYKHSPQIRRVLNLYGPTEDTTYSTWRQVERGTSREPEIGRGLPNTRVYILDAALQMAPVGVSGELYISGDGLARGYLGQPALTAERFLPDPHNTEPGARMYRTGDVARYTRSGELEYLGRIDQQVKVRGYRIELGEIEVALTERAEVRECAVIVRETRSGDKQLVAFVVPEGELRRDELRQALRKRLPDYMAPATFVVLDALPLTPNGKVNRRLLAGFKLEETEQERGYEAPETPTQKLLAGIWQEVLDLNRVGINDNFFELGGHSLTATRLVSRMQAAFGVKLSLRTLFATPTITALADAIETAMFENSSQEKIDALLSHLDNLDESATLDMLSGD
ncbi:MAG TPA: amino acid adenylation domain-containing protein [Pyrinomonadaceae bacterium]|nr:amino acid adenylation domain-containing protein [Pyrinomonadaceae bacterium]